MKRLLILALALVLAFGTLAGCGGSRTALTAEEFATKAEAAGYEVVDATGQFETGLVDSVQLAVGSAFQVEFFVFPNSEGALVSYNTNKATVEAAKEGTSAYKSGDAGDYNYYYLTSGGTYYVVARTENTMLFAHCDEADKGELEKFVSDLGY